MGNATTWSIFFSIVAGCLLVVLYSLLGRHRSLLVAMPTALVLILALTALITSPRAFPIFTVPLAIGSLAGLVRQFRRPDGMDH